MISLSNEHSFEYMVARGALAYDGRGWPWEWPLRWLGLLDPKRFTIVTKTLTQKPRAGNLRWSHPWSCVSLLKNGVVNAIGLTNPGIDWWVREVAPLLAQNGFDLVASITDDDPQALVQMVKALDPFPLKAIEFNASCPNTVQEIHHNSELIISSVKAMKEASRHPLLLKLSIHQGYAEIAKRTEGIVEAISINSVPWKIAFPEALSPLEKFGGGGVSGKVARQWTWKMVEELSNKCATPVIGPGIWEFEDLDRLRQLGAKALSFGSIFMRYPWRPTAFIKRDSAGRME
jgi:dihydroorotate dehydrogenase (NAD+) catalytic subunit